MAFDILFENPDGSDNVYRVMPQLPVEMAIRRGLTIPKSFPLEETGSWNFNDPKLPFTPDTSSWTGNVALQAEEATLMALTVVRQTDTYFRQHAQAEAIETSNTARARCIRNLALGTTSLSGSVVLEALDPHGISPDSSNLVSGVLMLTSLVSMIKTVGYGGIWRQFSRRIKEADESTPEHEARNDQLRDYVYDFYNQPTA